MSKRGRWLNGWKRELGTHFILIKSELCCVGCGRNWGSAAYAHTPGYVESREAPDWPFPEDDCPVCENSQERETIEDISLLPLSLLRQAIARAKQRVGAMLNDVSRAQKRAAAEDGSEHDQA